MKSNDDSTLSTNKIDIPLESVSNFETDGPRFPVPDIPFDKIQRPDLVALPALNQSDQYLHLALSEIMDEGISKLLSQTTLIEKIVATIDNLPRKYVAERMRPLAAIENSFIVERQPDTSDSPIEAPRSSRAWRTIAAGGNFLYRPASPAKNKTKRGRNGKGFSRIHTRSANARAAQR